MDHDERSRRVRTETLEELGLTITLDDIEPVVTQNIFNDEGISFVSFTYRATWNGDVGQLTLQTEKFPLLHGSNPKKHSDKPSRILTEKRLKPVVIEPSRAASSASSKPSG